MSLNHRPDDVGLELVQPQPWEPQDEETRRLNEADQLRADLKAETGYHSYVEYLSAQKGSRHEFSLLDRNFGYEKMGFTSTGDLSHQTRVPKSNCSILDLSRDSKSQAKITFRCQIFSAANTLTNLRHPPTESSVQVCLWPTYRFSSEWVNTLGLGLRIDAPFFEAVCERMSRTEEWRRDGDELRNETHRYRQPFAPAHLEIDGKIITIANHLSSNQIRHVPVVLIAGPISNFCWIGQNISDVLPLLVNSDEINSLGLPDSPQWWRDPSGAGGYARVLHRCLRSGEGVADSIDKLMLGALLPIIFKSTFRIHGQCLESRHTYLALLDVPTEDEKKYGDKRNKIISDLYQQRILLRRVIENYKDDLVQLTGYRGLHAMTDCLPAYSRFLEHTDQICEAAHRLEAEITASLQLHAGEMALQETRKSIELSSIQVEESKRAKLFTVLAFIYVPLNLATSIFGMNIYQLNRSGQDISAFIATALSALAVTGGVWYLIEQANSYRKWQEGCLRKDLHEATKFTLMTRISMLIWLGLSQDRYLMTRRGLWWRVLINNKSRLCYEDTSYCNDQDHPTAAEIVSAYSTGGGTFENGYQHWEWKSAPPKHRLVKLKGK